MIFKTTWPVAESAVDRYNALLQGFSGLFSQALSSPDFTSSKARTWLSKSAYTLARSFLENERAIAQVETLESGLRGASAGVNDLGGIRHDPEVGTQLSELASASCDALIREIAIQIERDILTLVKKLRDLALSVNLMSSSGRLSRKAAMTKVKIDQGTSPSFSFVDRANRKLPSHKFIRAIWRQHLLTAHIEAHAKFLANAGLTRASIQSPNADHRFNNMIVGLTGEDDLPPLVDVMQEVFHPNSEAYLRASY